MKHYASICLLVNRSSSWSSQRSAQEGLAVNLTVARWDGGAGAATDGGARIAVLARPTVETGSLVPGAGAELLYFLNTGTASFSVFVILVGTGRPRWPPLLQIRHTEAPKISSTGTVIIFVRPRLASIPQVSIKSGQWCFLKLTAHAWRLNFLAGLSAVCGWSCNAFFLFLL
jgi:hypothetical protein